MDIESNDETFPANCLEWDNFAFPVTPPLLMEIIRSTTEINGARLAIP